MVAGLEIESEVDGVRFTLDKVKYGVCENQYVVMIPITILFPLHSKVKITVKELKDESASE